MKSFPNVPFIHVCWKTVNKLEIHDINIVKSKLSPILKSSMLLSPKVRSSLLLSSIKHVIKEMISSSPEVSSTAQLAQVRTETFRLVSFRCTESNVE